MTTDAATRVKSLWNNRSLRARFGLTLLVALVLHLPATPIMMVFSFVSTLIDLKDAERVDYDAGPMTIAIDLDPLQPKPPPPPAKDNVNAVQMEPERPQESVKIPKGEERQTESKPEQPDKESDDAEKAKKKKEEKKPPEALGMTGEMNKSVEGKTNVTFTLWFSTLRDSPAAESLRPLFACGVLGAAFQRAGIDPIRDLDGALFAGQQLSDPAKYLVAVHHHLGKQQLHDAIDKLIRPKGVWIDEQAAKFYVAKANRVAFTHGNSLLFITPEPGWEQIRAIKKPLSVPAGRGRALSLNLLKPAIPFRKFGLRLPESVAEMRLDLFLSVTGTSEVQLRFEDKDAALATRHAPEISARLKDFLWQVQKVSDLSGLLAPTAAPGSIDLPDVPLLADDKAVVGQATLTLEQTAKLVSKLSALLCAKPKTQPQASASQAPVPSAAPIPSASTTPP